jgi:glycosyltransferase involved in cell wall biosynthesis
MGTDEASVASVEERVDVARRVPVTVLLPVLNEEENLGAALESVRWADRVIVVDSHSTDATVKIARGAGADVVQFDYPGHGPKKMNWSLESLHLGNEWVLILAADERVPAALRDEIESAVANPTADGYCLDKEFIFMGRRLRCHSPNWDLRLFRHDLGRFEDLGLHDLPGTGDMEVHEHVALRGRVGFLKTPLLHDDYRGLTPWLERHNRYATWEAHLYRKLRLEPVGVGPLALLRLDPLRRKRALRRIWVRLPFRSPLRFFVWYALRGGFLDGRPGFVFCVLMGYYEFVIGAKIWELERACRVGEARADRRR